MKFRGKFSKDKEWKYGFLGRGKNFHTGKKYLLIQHSDIESTQVENSSIGQYTGLKDKNGKEIYEGDICRSEEFVIIAPIEYCNLNTRFNFAWKKAFWYEDGNSWGNDLVVIGNIYEDKELITNE